MDDTTPRPPAAIGSCPHIDHNDLRCATRFNLGRIDQAFSVCFGSFHGCPMYHRINAELAQTAAHNTDAAVVAVTNGDRRLLLRATGT